jgi:hypothetical protein
MGLKFNMHLWIIFSTLKSFKFLKLNW